MNENGIEIPEGMTVQFVEGKESEILVPLPPRPPGSKELSEEDQAKVVGGAFQVATFNDEMGES